MKPPPVNRRVIPKAKKCDVVSQRHFPAKTGDFDDQRHFPVETTGKYRSRGRLGVLVNESGFYSLILSSKLETAKRIQKMGYKCCSAINQKIWLL